MELNSIEREIHIEASPDVVFEVISAPEHVRQWWPDEAAYEPTLGSSGDIVFGSRSAPDAKVVALTVVEAEPSRRFAFRWVYDDAEATPENSLLVTFDLVPSGSGTLLRFTETGFRDKGWAPAELEQNYTEHVHGWDYFLPRLVTYVARLVAAR